MNVTDNTLDKVEEWPATDSGCHAFAIMNAKGDEKMSWSTTNPEACQQAKTILDEYLGQGRGTAYDVSLKPDGTPKDTQILKGEFDPAKHERTLLVPRMVGG